jgi:hypothetical protein
MVFITQHQILSFNVNVDLRADNHGLHKNVKIPLNKGER